MSIIKKEDILAYQFEDKIICAACHAGVQGELTEDQIITCDDLDKDDGSMYFCDQCKKQIGE